MGQDYSDRWITCGPSDVRIRGYYFPWGTKRIPYASIRAVRRVKIGTLTGRGRIWGTSNPRFWAGFDPSRPRKTSGLILDLGKFVKPFVTPDDTAAAEAVIRGRAGLGPAPEEPPPSPGPLL
jgi:hypothetical protein